MVGNRSPPLRFRLDLSAQRCRRGAKPIARSACVGGIVVSRDTFEEACERAERAKRPKDPHVLRLRRLLDSTSLEAAWTELNTFHDRAASSTVEALMLGLRSRGTKALKEPAVRQRLSKLNESQMREVGTRLQRLKPEIAKAWNVDEVVVLVSTWTDSKNGQR
jgi:hypothetical protein